MSRYVNVDDIQDWLSKLVVTKLEKSESTTEIRLLKTFIDSMVESDVIVGDKLFTVLAKSDKCPDALGFRLVNSDSCDGNLSTCCECWRKAIIEVLNNEIIK